MSEVSAATAGWEQTLENTRVNLDKELRDKGLDIATLTSEAAGLNKNDADYDAKWKALVGKISEAQDIVNGIRDPSRKIVKEFFDPYMKLKRAMLG